eukprot:136789-Prymnesium_polylepis.1
MRGVQDACEPSVVTRCYLQSIPTERGVGDLAALLSFSLSGRLPNWTGGAPRPVASKRERLDDPPPMSSDQPSCP